MIADLIEFLYILELANDVSIQMRDFSQGDSILVSNAIRVLNQKQVPIKLHFDLAKESQLRKDVCDHNVINIAHLKIIVSCDTKPDSKTVKNYSEF